jgi:hypothetical protein
MPEFSPLDVAAWVVALAEPAAAAAGASVTVWEVTAVPRGEAWQGGAPLRLATTVQADVRGPDKPTTRAAAVAVAAALVDPDTDYAVRLVAGPFWLADGDGSPRYVLRAEVSTRAAG